MKFYPLGNTDIQLSSIIMGTWQAGKAMWTGIDDNEIIKAVKAAFDSGITTFDTAEVYGNGHSEMILGKGLKGIRDKTVIASKVFSNHLKYEQIKKACHRSLKNLGTDYIDLYQIHWPPGSFGHPKVPFDEIMSALTELKKEGKIRAIGVSNFDKDQIEKVREFDAIESLQPPYSLFWRKMETETLPYCAKNNITVLAYSPMAQGLLTGKFKKGHTFEKGDHRSSNILFKGENFERALAAIDELTPIASKYDATLGQLALAFITHQKNFCAIAGARNTEQVTLSAKAGDIELSQEDFNLMDNISKTVTEHLDDDPVMWKW